MDDEGALRPTEEPGSAQAPDRPGVSAGGRPSVRGFMRGRAPSVLAMGACAVVATLVAAPYPERSEQGVSELLARAAGGAVSPDDFVWEPSRGFVDDLVFGRGVLFLAESGPSKKRDLFRGRVSVTRQGRPLAVRSLVNLSHTDLADERSLVVSGHEATVSAEWAGRIRGVYWIDLGASHEGAGRPRDLSAVSVVAVSFAHPPARERHELQSGSLVLSLGEESESVSVDPRTLTVTSATRHYDAHAVHCHWSSLALDAPAARLYGWAKHPSNDASATIALPTDVLVEPAPAPRPFPPSDRFSAAPPPDWQGDSPSFVARSDGRVQLALDMRQLEISVVPGIDSPISQTGQRARGMATLRGAPSVVVAGPGAPGVAAIDGGNVVSPFQPGQWGLTDGAIPRVRRFSGVGDAGAPSSADAATDALGALGFVASTAAQRPRAMLCATASGHFVYSWGSKETAASIRSSLDDVDCVARLPVEGDLLGAAVGRGDVHSWSSLDPAMTMQWREAGGAVPVFAFHRRDVGPSVAPPRGTKWSPEDAPQPEPRFAPAIYRASVDALGTRVDVRLFVAGRFDWVLRAGDKEKSHRMGGTFERSLDDASQARAFFAMGLGIGKRRSPFGLRIAGSLGHAFHREATLVSAGRGALVVGHALPDDAEVDASELLPTASGGALLPAARERGPRQARGDLCTLEDGTVLYAEAEFDNHEATATVLQTLGCSEVVGVDRGADQPAWTETRDHLGAHHDATTLFALARPAAGPVRVDPDGD